MMIKRTLAATALTAAALVGGLASTAPAHAEPIVVTDVQIDLLGNFEVKIAIPVIN